MTTTRYTLQDVGGALSWGALSHFVQYLPRESALSREIRPLSDEELWANGNATAAILADIYDLLSQFNVNFCSVSSRKRSYAAKPYSRPWAKDTGQRVLGSDPVPVSEFEDWWASET